jgi:hypothetical protein
MLTLGTTRAAGDTGGESSSSDDSDSARCGGSSGSSPQLLLLRVCACSVSQLLLLRVCACSVSLLLLLRVCACSVAGGAGVEAVGARDDVRVARWFEARCCTRSARSRSDAPNVTARSRMSCVPRTTTTTTTTTRSTQPRRQTELRRGGWWHPTASHSAQLTRASPRGQVGFGVLRISDFRWPPALIVRRRCRVRAPEEKCRRGWWESPAAASPP